jgi:hypothetical protein
MDRVRLGQNAHGGERSGIEPELRRTCSVLVPPAFPCRERRCEQEALRVDVAERSVLVPQVGGDPEPTCELPRLLSGCFAALHVEDPRDGSLVRRRAGLHRCEERERAAENCN